MFVFHPEVADLFRSAGWLPERRVEIATWEEALRARGIPIFPAAERVIASVGGLTVRGPARVETRWCPRAITFDPLAGSAGGCEQFERWRELVGQRLYPLADLKPRLCLTVAEDGSLFAGQKDLFYRYGDTFEEAMALHFLGAGTRPLQGQWCD
ncbi:MAG: SUKH-3 domain-containing protein [Planctomycetes bacterium]|nr:SUKH-3 domain-containing protein [Planctomycetota bacterium]